jgi:hypothetical protein
VFLAYAAESAQRCAHRSYLSMSAHASRTRHFDCSFLLRRQTWLAQTENPRFCDGIPKSSALDEPTDASIDPGREPGRTKTAGSQDWPSDVEIDSRRWWAGLRSRRTRANLSRDPVNQ